MTSTINTGQPFYLQSQVGTTVLPDFQGGTLRIDTAGATDNNNYTVENFATNTIDEFGHSIVFSATFSGAGPLEITDSVGGGLMIVTGESVLGGTLTVDSSATLQWGNGNAAYLIDGSDGVVDNGTLLVDYGTGAVGGTIPISGSGRVMIQSGSLSDAGASTYTGATTIASPGDLLLSGSGSVADSSAVSDNGTFDISGTTAGASIITLIGSGVVNLGNQTLTITDGSGSFSGVLADGGMGGSLTIAGGTETLTGTNTFTGTTTINTGAILQFGGAGTVAGAIVDNGSILFAYSGPVIVGNTFTGTGSAEVTAGTAVITGATEIGGTLTIDNGATMQWGNSNPAFLLGGGGGIGDNGSLVLDYGGGGVAGTIPISGYGSVTMESGDMNNAGVSTYTGTTTIDASGFFALSAGGSISDSSVVIDNGTFDISGQTAETLIVGLAGSGLVALGGQGLTITNASSTFSGVLADGGYFGGAGGSLTIAGGTETLSATNTFSGTTTINAGAILQLGAGGTIGTVAGSIDDNGLIRFDYSGPVTNANSFSGSGSVEVVAGTMVETDAAALGGTVTIDSGAAMQWGSGTPAFLFGNTGITDNGTLLMDLGTGSVGTFAPIWGSGKVTIESGGYSEAGADTYTGSTIIDAGAEYLLFDSGSIANSSVVDDDGTFDISGTYAGASITALTGSGLLSLGGQRLTLTHAVDTFTGVLADGGISGGTGGSLTIAGGTETLTGTNTFTGETIVNSAATLQLGTGGATGTVAGPVELASGATLEVMHSAGTAETLRLTLDGNDVVTGGAGNETFSVGASFTVNDTVNGGAGTNSLVLAGNYTGTHALTLGASTLTNIADIYLGTGFSYTLTFNAATLTSGHSMNISGTTLVSGDNIALNAGAMTGGTLTVDTGGGTNMATFGAGTDVFNGGSGNDEVIYTTGFTAADQINGGGGTNNMLVLNGNYTGSSEVVMGATTLTNFQEIFLDKGFSYDLAANAATVTSGHTLEIDGLSLVSGNNLTFTGTSVGGKLLVYCGAGINNISGGDSGDTFYAETGTDTFNYASAAQSTNTTYDTINGMNFGTDKFNVVPTITGINTAITSGTLSTATFNSDLAAAVNFSHLGADHAVLFTPNAGTLSGQTFLIVDLNATAGYQAGADLVIHLSGTTGTLTTGDFI